MFFCQIVGLNSPHIWCHLTELASLTVSEIPMLTWVSGTPCIYFLSCVTIYMKTFVTTYPSSYVVHKTKCHYLHICEFLFDCVFKPSRNYKSFSVNCVLRYCRATKRNWLGAPPLPLDCNKFGITLIQSISLGIWSFQTNIRIY